MKWTIATVNYHTQDWLGYQLKGLYEFNNSDDFELIIVEHSPEPYRVLDEFANQYDNIRVVYNPGPGQPGGWWNGHGEGLTKAKELANSTYFLAQDPDFFWLVKNHLDFLQEFLDSGYVAVGAPYTHKTVLTAPNFPVPWACAYRLSDLKSLDFNIDWDAKNKCCINDRDVGWKISEKFSHRRYFSFKPVEYVGENHGEYSQNYWPCAYEHNGQLVGVHMRGVGYDNPIPTQTQSVARWEHSKFLYEKLCDSLLPLNAKRNQ